MKRLISLVILLFSLTAFAHEIVTQFNDIPTTVLPVTNGHRVIFSEHEGVYYLLKSDVDFEKNLKIIEASIKSRHSVTVDAESTYLTIRKVKP
jgi:hypothetical protein